jgi:hypothetical protein
MKAKKPYTLINIDTRCLIQYDTGRKSEFWPYDPIVSLIEVSTDNRGAKCEETCYRLLRHRGDSLANWQGRDNAIRYTSAEAVAEAEAQVEKLWREHDRAIMRGKKSWQFTKLTEFAARFGWPTRYTTDLTEHDAGVLGSQNPTEFVGLVRECGTSICTPESPADEWRQAEAKHYGTTAHYYHITQQRTREITPAQYAAWKWAA